MQRKLGGPGVHAADYSNYLPGNADCVEDHSREMAERVKCVLSERDHQLGRLDHIYKRLVRLVNDDAKKKIVDAQRIWMLLRVMDRTLDASIAKGRSSEDFMVAMNDMNRICTRANVLEIYLETVQEDWKSVMEKDGHVFCLTRPLYTAVDWHALQKGLDKYKGLRESQRLWEELQVMDKKFELAIAYDYPNRQLLERARQIESCMIENDY